MIVWNWLKEAMLKLAPIFIILILIFLIIFISNEFRKREETKIDLQMDGIVYNLTKKEVVEQKSMDFDGIQTVRLFSKFKDVTGILAIDETEQEIDIVITKGRPNTGYFTWFGGIFGKASDDLESFILFFNCPNNRNFGLPLTEEDSIVWVFSEQGAYEATKIAETIIP